MSGSNYYIIKEPSSVVISSSSASFSLVPRSTSYSTLPAMNFLNSITLRVRVPVLSLKTYSIWPSSSFRVEDWAFAGKSYSASYILYSYSINIAYQNFTISNVTIKLIGTKLVFINIHVPVFNIHNNPQLVCH